MKVKIEFDTTIPLQKQLTELTEFLKNQNINNNQQQLTTNTNELSIVVRDGDTKKTIDVKEELKQLGFTYYAKTKTGKQDPRWTQTCTRKHWNEIKDKDILTGLNIWTSEGG